MAISFLLMLFFSTKTLMLTSKNILNLKPKMTRKIFHNRFNTVKANMQAQKSRSTILTSLKSYPFSFENISTERQKRRIMIKTIFALISPSINLIDIVLLKKFIRNTKLVQPDSAKQSFALVKVRMY